MPCCTNRRIEKLADELTNVAAHGARHVRVLVLIDQAEELYTRTGTDERQMFLALLGEALEEDSPVWVVATVRSEFRARTPGGRVWLRQLMSR